MHSRPNANAPRGPKSKFVVKVTRVGRVMIISLSRSKYVLAEYDAVAGRWGTAKLLGDGFREEIATVLLQRIASRAGDGVKLLRPVQVSRAEFALLAWLSGAKKEPHRLVHRLAKAYRKTLERSGRVELNEAVIKARERLDQILDRLP